MGSSESELLSLVGRKSGLNGVPGQPPRGQSAPLLVPLPGGFGKQQCTRGGPAQQ